MGKEVLVEEVSAEQLNTIKLLQTEIETLRKVNTDQSARILDLSSINEALQAQRNVQANEAARAQANCNLLQKEVGLLQKRLDDVNSAKANSSR